jgi:hypothetical protein
MSVLPVTAELLRSFYERLTSLNWLWFLLLSNIEALLKTMRVSSNSFKTILEISYYKFT